MIIDLPIKGGSGHGISRWTKRGTDCLIACDFEEQGIVLPPSQAFSIGTMFHKYAEACRSGELAWHTEDPIEFTLGGEPIDQAWQDEAHRLWLAYAESDIYDVGPVLATELHLSGPEVEAEVGVSPYTAQIDLLCGTKDNAAMIDYKTSSRSGNTYATGKTRIQMHAYWLAAVAAGYNVRRILVHQVVKTKKVQCHEYEIDLPTPGQIRKLRRYLAAAKRRWECGERMALLPYCDGCPYRTNGHCI